MTALTDASRIAAEAWQQPLIIAERLPEPPTMPRQRWSQSDGDLALIVVALAIIGSLWLVGLWTVVMWLMAALRGMGL